GAEHDEDLVLDVLEKSPERESVNPRDDVEDDEDEDRHGQIDISHQPCERDERLEAECANGVRHRAERTEGRDLHDHCRQSEKHCGQSFESIQDRLPCLPNAEQCEAEHQRKENDLENLTVGECADKAGWKNVSENRSETKIGR